MPKKDKNKLPSKAQQKNREQEEKARKANSGAPFVSLKQGIIIVFFLMAAAFTPFPGFLIALGLVGGGLAIKGIYTAGTAGVTALGGLLMKGISKGGALAVKGIVRGVKFVGGKAKSGCVALWNKITGVQPQAQQVQPQAQQVQPQAQQVQPQAQQVQPQPNPSSAQTHLFTQPLKPLSTTFNTLYKPLPGSSPESQARAEQPIASISHTRKGRHKQDKPPHRGPGM